MSYQIGSLDELGVTFGFKVVQTVVSESAMVRKWKVYKTGFYDREIAEIVLDKYRASFPWRYNDSGRWNRCQSYHSCLKSIVTCWITNNIKDSFN